MNVKIGASTACMYPEELENSLEKLCAMGIKNTEIFLNSHCELEKDFLNKLKGILDRYGTRCVSLHPYTCAIEPMMLFTYYKRRYVDMLEYHKKYFDAMNFLGAENFILHGNKPQNKFSDEDYFERYEGLYDLGRSFGVTVTQENVARCTGGSLEFLVKMKNALGDKAKFTLDVKQAVRRGYSPYEFVEKLGENIVHIHLSDHNDESDCTKVGLGRLDFGRFYRKLCEKGFCGNLILELYRWGFGNENELLENCQLIESTVLQNAF